MNTETLNQEILKRYLLDDISEEEKVKIEEQFLQDDSFFEEMLALEDELYFDYRQNRLNTHERAVFEQKFLQSAADKEKSAFAAVFIKAATETEKNSMVGEKIVKETSVTSFWQSISDLFNFSNRSLQFGFGAILVLLLLGAIGFFIQNNSPQNEIANSGNNSPQNQQPIIAQKDKQETDLKLSENEKPQSSPNDKQPETNPLIDESEIAESRQPAQQTPKKENSQSSKKQIQPPTETRSIIAVVLSPGLFTRSDGQGLQRVMILLSVKNLQLRLLLKNEETYKSYRAKLRTLDDGTDVWNSGELKLQNGKNKSLLVTIPTKNLTRADYEILLFGVTESGENEEITNYYFSVVKNTTK